MFISPLFNEDVMNGEIEIIEAEFQSAKDQDDRRFLQLEKSLSNPEHPYSIFTTGNKKSLGEIPHKLGLNIREETEKFFKSHYSANLMKLVILGREPIEELQGFTEQFFGRIPNRNVTVNTTNVNIWENRHFAANYFVEPLLNIHMLVISFPIPAKASMGNTKAGVYLCHLLGHEGDGSLLAFLKQGGLATDLRADIHGISKDIEFFKIEVALTLHGVMQYENVIKALFRYIQLIKHEGPKEWIWQECQRIQNAVFKYGKKASAHNTVLMAAKNMLADIPSSWILSGPLVWREFNASRINECMQYLQPDNFRFYLASKDIGNMYDLSEEYFGTKYKFANLSEQFLHSLKSMSMDNDTQGLHLPRPNKFIPSSFDVNPSTESSLRQGPQIIKNSSLVRLWHKKDNKFLLPCVDSYFEISSPAVAASLDSFVKAAIFVELVADNLAEVSYYANTAMLYYRLKHRHQGLLLMITGFNDKHADFLRVIIHEFVHLSVDPSRFAVLKDKLIRNLKDESHTAPYDQVRDYQNKFFSDVSYSSADTLAALERLEVDSFREFIPQLFERIHVEGLVSGNINREEALEVAQIIHAAFQNSSSCDRIISRSLMLPNSSHTIVDLRLPDGNGMNSAIDIAFRVARTEDSYERVLLKLFTHIFSHNIKKKLRRNEKLGYVVFVRCVIADTEMGLYILVQSTRHPLYLESRIEQALADLEGPIIRMEPWKFDQYVQSLIDQTPTSSVSLADENSKYWRHILSGTYDFDRCKCISFLSTSGLNLSSFY